MLAIILQIDVSGYVWWVCFVCICCVCMCLCVHKDCIAHAFYIKIKSLFAWVNPSRLLELHCMPEEDLKGRERSKSRERDIDPWNTVFIWSLLGPHGPYFLRMGS